jgi:hypothetical protein
VGVAVHCVGAVLGLADVDVIYMKCHFSGQTGCALMRFGRAPFSGGRSGPLIWFQLLFIKFNVAVSGENIRKKIA